MAFDSSQFIDRRVMRLERRIARDQRRMLRHQLRMRRHQLRMLSHQQKLQRRAMRVPAMLNRTFGSDGTFGPRGSFGHGGMFGHRGIFGHRRVFGARSTGLWRRRRRRLFPVLLGLLLVGIATAMASTRGERPGNWVSI